MAWWLLAACSLGKGPNEISTDTLWEPEVGDLTAFRVLDAGAEPSADTAALTDSLLHASVGTGGCSSGEGLLVELRYGEDWGSASAWGGLHLDLADGLGLCAFEDDAGALLLFDPVIPLWSSGTVAEGAAEPVGGWTVTVARRSDVATYYGVFDDATSFTLSGSGGLDGWTLLLAPDVGPILLDTPGWTADVVYFR